jgi:hypothetical protein
MVAEATFAQTLNQKLEQTHAQIFSAMYKLSLLYLKLAKQGKALDTAEEFFNEFNDCMESDQNSS